MDLVHSTGKKKFFFLLNFYTTKLGIDICTWNFSESGHGKGVADGIGGSVKRTLDKQVAYGWDITNGKEAFEILKSASKSIKFFFVEDFEIQMVQNNVPIDLKPVPGTLQIHQVLCTSNSSILQYRVLSCFCQIDYICECFELKKHSLPNCPTDKEPFNLIHSPELTLTGTLLESNTKFRRQFTSRK
ncbi:unnamed protein product [Diatraea saccharalis]|uniref:Uncharacterized protein n=1 Tax=Diatraea saccharalis TaxID=40085 RepID=A0A9N9RAC2_9NEOP|nr:unnamed protein product [Diatraea saccharalis]